MSDLESKEKTLVGLLSGMPGVVVAYSGGVDSALLAAVSHEVHGERSLAVTAASPSMARRELDSARRLAARFGWKHRVVQTDEAAREEYARNSADRCYWCKTELFEVLEPLARDLGAEIAVGTNLDDLGDYRPGIRAATERRVRTPLADAGLSKKEVRLLSAAREMPTADKPASPCLASRFAYGVRVTPEGLERIDAAEEIVRSFGFEVFRVRDHGELARLEVPAGEITRAAELRSELTARLRELGYTYVTLDLAGFRSGSMNEALGLPSIRKG